MSNDELITLANAASQTNAAWESVRVAVVGAVVNALVVLVAVGQPLIGRRRELQRTRLIHANAVTTCHDAIAVLEAARIWADRARNAQLITGDDLEAHRRKFTAVHERLTLYFGRAGDDADLLSLIARSAAAISNALRLLETLKAGEAIYDEYVKPHVVSEEWTALNAFHWRLARMEEFDELRFEADRLARKYRNV